MTPLYVCFTANGLAELENKLNSIDHELYDIQQITSCVVGSNIVYTVILVHFDM